LSIVGKALAGLLQQIGCHVEIALGRFDIDVAEIRSESGQQALDVPARSIPRDNSMDRRCVSNVVDARKTTFGTGATDTCCSSHLLKQRNHMWIRPASARLRRKETRIVTQRQWKLAPPLNIDSQFSCEFWSDGHEPCLEELCVANRHKPLDNIDIAQGQLEGFANAEAASV